MEAIVAARAWNEKYPPSTNVIVTKDDGSQFHTKTRSHAGVLGEHTVVVWVDGTTGCHDIERVRAAEPTAESVKPKPEVNIKMESKQYLGDGVYASTDGYNIQITTENGIEVANTIFLEPSVFSALIAYSKANIG